MAEPMNDVTNDLNSNAIDIMVESGANWYHNWLVVTDLDGTLLDHHTYSWQPAAEAIALLQRHEIPLILSSSKTLAEMSVLAEDIGLSGPLIVENGAAVVWRSWRTLPLSERGALPATKTSQQPTEQLPELPELPEIETLGKPRDEVLAVVHRLRQAEGYQFAGFADWSVDQVVEHTGLPQVSAALAQDRHGTEPIIWQDTEERFARFVNQLAAEHIRAVRGGRFIHLMGQFDKADGLRRVAEVFEQQRRLSQVNATSHEKPDDARRLVKAARKDLVNHTRIVALGDSPNDAAMLSAADVAVQIHSPKSAAMDIAAPVLLQPRGAGPVGWAEALADWWRHQGDLIT